MPTHPQPHVPLGGEIERLIQEAKAGSRVALGQLLEAYRHLLLWQAAGKLPAHLRAKEGMSDLVQDTFLEAQRDFEHFRGTSEPEFQAWLGQILTHNAHNLARKYGTVRRNIGREEPLDNSGRPGNPCSGLPADTPSPSSAASSGEEWALLDRALARLAEKDRQVIELRHLDQLTFPEVGWKLGISAEAARKCFARAIEKLQEQIEAIQQEQRMSKPEPGHEG